MRYPNQKQDLWRLLPFGLAFACATALATFGCRAKMEVEVKSGGQSAAISIEDGAVIPRLYFQSGSVITLSLNHDQIKNGDRFAMINETTGETLIDQQVLDLNNYRTTEEGYSLSENGFDVQVKFYPHAKVNADKLVYGTNKLRLEIEDKVGSKFLEREIVLRDFQMFGVGGTLFSGNLPKKEGLQGSFTGVVHPIVRGTDETGKGFILRSGFFHAINH